MLKNSISMEKTMESFDEPKSMVARLRAEDGCPWDREQTHVSLKPECVEEAKNLIDEAKKRKGHE